MPPNKLHQDNKVLVNMDEIYEIKEKLALMKRDQEIADKRLSFLEKITFGAIGVVVLGVLSVVGGVIIWALSVMGVRSK